MGRLYDYVIEVKELSRQAFAGAHDQFFLLLHVPDKKKPDHQWTFNTQTLSSSGMSIAQLMVKEGFRLSPEIANYHVFPVVKGMNNPWPERVSVGRARNNDIVLADASVSKLHGHFIKDGEDAFLVDAGSRNGTRLNDKALIEQERYAIHAGDLITFGGATVTYLDAGRLYDLVKRWIQPAS